MLRKVSVGSMGFLFGALLCPSFSMACAVCFGDPNSKLTTGLNLAIISLLIILAGIFTIFIKFLIGFKKRAQLTVK